MTQLGAQTKVQKVHSIFKIRDSRFEIHDSIDKIMEPVTERHQTVLNKDQSNMLPITLGALLI